MTMATEEETAAAAAAAHGAAREAYLSGRTKAYEWRKAQLLAIDRMLSEKEAELQSALQSDLGKSPWESSYTEIHPLRRSCRYMLRNLRRLMRPTSATLPLHLSLGSAAIVPEPLGAALIISAWNYPLLLSLDPLIAAIAAGNAVVLKPSDLSPATSAALYSLLPSYIPDPSAASVVPGGPSAASALLSLRWDKIFFTGSANVGRAVAAAAAVHLTPVTLELGGKCPVLVSRTADLTLAARRIAAFKWGFNAGQACIAPDYVLVDRSVREEFVRELSRVMREFVGGEKEEGGGVRIVNVQHYRRLRRMVGEAVGEGAKEVKWWEGAAAEAEAEAEEGGELRMRAAVLLNPGMETELMKEEIFGPVLAVVEVGSVAEEGLEIVKGMEKPLALYVFSGDKEEAAKIVGRTSSGAAVVNDVGVQFTVESLPFGGVGSSGMGAYHGHFGFREFSHYKPVLRAGGDAPFRYPPFTPRKQALLSALASHNYLRFFSLLLGLRA